ncbi:choice-of-anchor D domain-containing protein, partial [Pontibacter saemangeumensis]|uniref:choice-of-anchor D domain-containing protein n=1 Tax=Pontibacter saemangeumensis TaxID=1084525 RepID=UPI0031EBC2DC
MFQTFTLFEFPSGRHTVKLLLLLLFCFAWVHQSHGQDVATLPTSNTNWGTAPSNVILPTGWSHNGITVASVDVPASGQAPSSAFYNTVKDIYIQIDFTGVPDRLSFNLRATALSGTFDGVFQVLESSTINGDYTVIGEDITTQVPSGSSKYYEVIRTLSSSTRSVRLFLKEKGIKHLHLDNAIITAAPVGPEINLKVVNTNIKSGDTHNFATVNLKKSKTVEFTVENTGTSTLRLDPLVLTGANAELFSVTSNGYAGSLEPSQNATFQVTFRPTAIGTYNAEVQIGNDDSDENPYRVILKGSGAILRPVITSLSSYVGGVGKEIIIDGSEFINANRVEFSNGISASFTIISDNQIRIYVPTGAVDGPITVFAGSMSASSEPFDVVPTPVISSVTPAEAYELDIVTISGSFLDGATEVAFNGVRTTFTERFNNDGNTIIEAKVPAGATTGPLTVTTLGGTATFDFTVLYKEPTIVSVNPDAAYELEIITITGTYLGSVTVVNFNGIDAAFEVDPESDGTIIYAEVPLGATSGPLTITTSGGTVTFDFTVLKPVPAGLTIDPTSGKEGSIVIISGANLADATSVVFSGDVEAVFAPITNDDGTVSLQATVPVGAQTGAITVANANGTGTTPTFTVIR